MVVTTLHSSGQIQPITLLLVEPRSDHGLTVDVEDQCSAVVSRHRPAQVSASAHVPLSVARRSSGDSQGGSVFTDLHLPLISVPRVPPRRAILHLAAQLHLLRGEHVSPRRDQPHAWFGNILKRDTTVAEHLNPHYRQRQQGTKREGNR